MANQKLILDAEIRDGITKKLREINKELNAIGKTEGMKSMDGFLGKLTSEANSFVKSGNGVAGAFSAMGIGGLAAGASMAAMVRAMTDLGKKQQDLAELGRELKMLPDDLNRIAKAAEYLRVPEEAMKGLVSGFAGQMPEFKRATGEMFKELSGIPGFLDNVYGRMKNENLGDAMIDGLRVAERVFKSKGGPQQAKKLLEQMFPGHADDAMKLIGDGHLDEFLKRLEQMKGKINPISPEFLKAQKDFADSVIDMNHAIENFETKAGPKFLHMLTEIVNLASRFFDKADTYKEQKEGGAKEEQKRAGTYSDADMQKWLQPPKNPAGTPFGALPSPGLFHKSSYSEGSPSGGLLQNAAYVEGGSASRSSGASSELLGIITNGTRTGVFLAFQDFENFKRIATKGGFQNASYEPGDGTGDGGHGGGGHGGAGGGGRRGFMRKGGDRDDFKHGPLLAGSKAGSLTALINAEAKRAGIDPRILEGIRAGESAHTNRYDFGDKNDGGAYGPFQFNMGKGRFGDQFLKQTGLDPRDPKTIPAQVRFMSEFIKHQLQRNPHYADGGNASPLHRVWHGFHGLRNADPHWGESGYVPSKEDREIGGDEPGDTGSSDYLKRARQGIGTFASLGRQCVDLVRSISGDRSGVQSWERGVGADEGTLKPGALLATFLDKNGRVSDRYAGGGIGTQGVHRDHAAVFDHYLMKEGQRIGMHVLEQDARHRIHEHDYMFGQGYGEANGSNYFAIKRNGQFLGGMNNPMNRRETNVAKNSDIPTSNGRAQVDVHIHTDEHGKPKVHKSTVKSDKLLEAKLKTWPTMTKPSYSA